MILHDPSFQFLGEKHTQKLSDLLYLTRVLSLRIHSQVCLQRTSVLRFGKLRCMSRESPLSAEMLGAVVDVATSLCLKLRRAKPPRKPQELSLFRLTGADLRRCFSPTLHCSEAGAAYRGATVSLLQRSYRGWEHCLVVKQC